jgi:hypothetical protein
VNLVTARTTPLVLGGRDRWLIFDLQALALASVALGVYLLADVRALIAPSLRELRVLLWAGLVRDDPALADARYMVHVASWVPATQLPSVLPVVMMAVQAALPEPDGQPRDPEADALKDAPRTTPLTWTELEALGRVELGLSESDFWQLTLRQFAAMMARVWERERRADLRIGILASLIANANRDPKKRQQPFTAFDFFPQLHVPTSPAQHSEELAKKAVRITQLLGGRVVHRKAEGNGESRQERNGHPTVVPA